jgi:5-methyltetrahydrofolate--homocysteine methyltransferase
VYQEQVQALMESGIEIFYVERCQDTLNAKAALTAIENVEHVSGKKLTKLVSGEPVEKGTMLFGDSFRAFWTMLEPFGVSAFGAVGSYELVKEAIDSLHEIDVPLMAMVDPCAVGSFEWIETPASFSSRLSALSRENPNVRIVGTGTLAEPDFIQALSETLKRN